MAILFLSAIISGLTVFAGTYRDQDVLEADVKTVEEADAGTGGGTTTDEQNSHIVNLDIEKGYTAYAEVMPEGIHGYVNSATVGITGMKASDRPEPVVLVDPPQSASFGPYDEDCKLQIEFKTNPEGDITVRKTYADGVYLFKCEDLKKKESDEDFDDFILKVIILKVDVLSVEGTDENGTLKVNCKATPTVHFTGYEYVLNGATINQGACDLNVGNFNFATDQDLFTEDNNTFEVKMKIESDHWCSASFTVEKKPHVKVSGIETVSAYFIAEGIGVRIFNHKVIAEGWYTLHYSVPQSGRILHVGSSLVSLFMGDEYGNVLWGEEHKYVNSAGTTGLQTMSPPSGPYIGVPNTEYRNNSNNIWPEMDDLKGVSTVNSLTYYLPGSIIPATPILNASIEVTLD